MIADLSEREAERITRALGDTPHAAYTTPHVYPWAAQGFVQKPFAERPRPAPGPLRLYVHIPFCNYRCTFCCFAVRVGAKDREKERYVGALERELACTESGASLEHLFVGGGTPTVLPADLLGRLLGAIFERARPSATNDYTVEASPESVNEAHLRVLRDHGVQRMSMGVESTDDTVLDAVRRRHTRERALDACRMIVESGIRLNVDLIYGLPGQTEDGFRRDLESVAATGVASLCLYALRVNDDTPVAGELDAAEQLGLLRVMRWRTFLRRAAEEVGFSQKRPYLFVRGASRAPAAPVMASGNLLGVGCSARSQLGAAVYRNHERVGTYIERIESGRSAVETIFELGVEDRKTQFFCATFGSGKAVDRDTYERLFGAPIESDFAETLQRLRDGGLIVDEGRRLELSESGLLVYDRVLLCFYPDAAKRRLRASANLEKAKGRRFSGAPSSTTTAPPTR